MTLRDLPQIQTLLAMPSLRDVAAAYTHAETVNALRDVVDDLRQRLLAGDRFDLPDFTGVAFASDIALRIDADRAPSLQPVINATGILIHTNLGRAPLAPRAIAAMEKVAKNGSNLELDLSTGKRGSRHSHVERLICELTGAEAAVVVNNCAAAVLLSLMACASGRKVIASRGELIEIGGAFRLPDVIQQSGAVLCEVGTTNKTRASDYSQAVDEDTAVLLKSHTSNFKIVGFTQTPNRRELAEIARERDLLLMEDLGSGVLVDLAPYGLAEEPVVAEVLKSGVDLVMFSGDKLLGGPQAGVLAGRPVVIDRLKSHPLMRAVRIDKLSLAALEATLQLYRPPFDPLREIPVLQMVSAPLAQLEARADRLTAALRAARIETVSSIESNARVGAGAMPEQDLKSAALSVTLPGLSAEALSTALRKGTPAIIGRIVQDTVVLDMRSMSETEDSQIITRLQQILAA